MIIVRTGQVWLSEPERRMVEVVGLTEGMKIRVSYRTAVRKLLRYAEIDPACLREAYRLITCPHEPDASDCEQCKCPFHGVENCTCRGGAR